MSTGYENRDRDHDPRTPRSPGLGIPASRRVRVRRPGETVEQMNAREDERDRLDEERGRRAKERARAAYLRGLG